MDGVPTPMFMELQNKMFSQIISDLGVQISALTFPVEKCGGFCDLGLRTALFGADTPFEETFPHPDESGEKVHILMARDQFRCNYILTFTPGSSEFGIIGPYMHKPLTIAEINHIFKSADVNITDMNYLRQYYHLMPVIRDENMLYTVLHACCVNIYGPDGFDITYGEIEQGTYKPHVVKDSHETLEYQRDFSDRIYAIEKQMLTGIKEGNFKAADAAIRKLEQRGAEARVSSTIRNYKNYAIVFNTMCRLAAKEGGAPAWEIDRISRNYSVQIENMTSIPELVTLREGMLKEYCRLVREGMNETYSPLVRKAADLILSDFSRHITLEETAANLNVSTGYLSSLFSRETGKSFSEYLIDTRIAHARYLLRDTGLSVSVIASECGITDANYFSRLFRQREKMTPMQYRRKLQEKEH